jgi:TRAP-type mannitol/chloroaromatic compound transport system permease small subunit
MSVEILGTVIVTLGFIALITWRFWPTVEQIQREQREQPFGSKRWHWPAAAFLGVSFLALMLLRLVTDSG